MAVAVDADVDVKADVKAGAQTLVGMFTQAGSDAHRF